MGSLCQRSAHSRCNKMMPNLLPILIVSILSVEETAGLQCYTCARGGQDCSQVREETCSGSIYQDQFCLKVAADDDVLVQKCYNPTTDGVYYPPSSSGCRDSTWGSAGQRTSCLCDQNLCNGAAASREKGVAMAISVLVSMLFCMWNI